MRKIMLVGGGGHCHSVIDSLLAMDIYDDIGIIDSVATSFFNIPVIGCDEDIPGLIERGWSEAFVSVGSVGNTEIRRRLYGMIKDYKLSVPSIVDPSAVVAKSSVIMEGTYIGKLAIVNANSSVGICSIINSGAIIEHDCKIGDFSHISPGSVICGQVTVGNDSHIGAGSTVIEQRSIGNGALIGAGSVVVKNVMSGTKNYGNPCKVI